MDSSNNNVDQTPEAVPQTDTNDVHASPAMTTPDTSNKNALIIGAVVVVIFVIAAGLGISLSKSPSLDTVTPMNTNQSGSVAAAYTGVVAVGDTVSVDYLGTLTEGGKIFDASREEDAKAGGVYQTARTYEPLRFSVGQGQMIAGFDKAVLGMKVGETKTFTVAPKDAYGEATTEETVARSQLADTITQTVAKEDLADRVVKTFPKTLFGDTGSLVAGGKIQIADGMSADVVSVTDTDVTIAIENTESPFYKKPIKIGSTGEYQGNTLTVSGETATGYVLAIENKTSPFYGKPLAVGLTGTAPDGTVLTITALTDDSVTVSIPNKHELAGKDLTFKVTVLGIEPRVSSSMSSESGAMSPEPMMPTGSLEGSPADSTGSATVSTGASTATGSEMQ